MLFMLIMSQCSVSEATRPAIVTAAKTLEHIIFIRSIRRLCLRFLILK